MLAFGMFATHDVFVKLLGQTYAPFQIMAERFPETGRIQFPPEGTELRAGWRLVQSDLANTLEAIAKEGPSAFYRGPIAAALAADVTRRGGLLTEQDLAGYRTRWREPVTGSYRGTGNIIAATLLDPSVLGGSNMVVGYGIIAGSLFFKLPQVFKILNAKSVAGIARSMFYSEVTRVHC